MVSAAWRMLDAEIARWRDAGRPVEFWWRDDDAVRPAPAVARLLDLAAQTGVPLALAVIPDSAVPELFALLGTGVSVLATFTVNNPPPSSGTLSPPSLSAGSSALVLAVAGTNFTTGSVVQVNGSARVTTFVSVTLLQATLLSSDLAHGGTLVITVNTPPPGGGTTIPGGTRYVSACGTGASTATWTSTTGESVIAGGARGSSDTRGNVAALLSLKAFCAVLCGIPALGRAAGNVASKGAPG